MESLASIMLGVLLVLLSAGLLVAHTRSWRRVQEEKPDARHLDFSRRQYRRRMQTSGMLGLAALGIVIGGLIPPRAYPSLFVCWWCAVVLLIAWILLLALGDAVATRAHYGLLANQQRRQRTQLESELRNLRQQSSNGHGGSAESNGTTDDTH